MEVIDMRRNDIKQKSTTFKVVERIYQDTNGNYYILRRNLSLNPAGYEVFGPSKMICKSMPRLFVKNIVCLGEKLTWIEAEQELFEHLGQPLVLFA